MPDKNIVGNRLKKLRGNKTLNEVAQDLGVTSMAISLWERGERTPNDEMKVRISQYYNMSITDIFFA